VAHLRWVREHAAKRRGFLDDETDAGIERRPQQCGRLAHRAAQIHGPQLERGSSREPEELAREIASQCGGAPDLFEQDCVQRVARRGLDEQREVAEQDREQIVEVVGDAPGELADRLHLLRLPQLFLEPAPLRDVLRDADDAVGLAVGGVAQLVRTIEDPANRSVGPHDAVLDHVRTVDRARAHRLHHARAVVLVDRLDPRQRLGVQARAGPSPDLLVRGADVDHLAVVFARDVEDLAQRLGHLAKAQLALAQRSFHALELGDVLHRHVQRGLAEDLDREDGRDGDPSGPVGLGDGHLVAEQPASFVHDLEQSCPRGLGLLALSGLLPLGILARREARGREHRVVVGDEFTRDVGDA
jgi:hypothetical protein